MRRSEDNFDFETAAKLLKGEKIQGEDLRRFVHLASTSHSRAIWIEVEIYLNQELARIREAEIILLKGLLLQEELKTQQMEDLLRENHLIHQRPPCPPGGVEGDTDGAAFPQ